MFGPRRVYVDRCLRDETVLGVQYGRSDAEQCRCCPRTFVSERPPSADHSSARRGADLTAPLAGAEARQRADLIRAVADSSHDALIALDGEGRVTATSARAELVLGYSERALLGRPLDAILIEARRDDFNALARSALDGADVFQHDSQVRRRDGVLIDIVVNLAPLRETPGGATVGVSIIIQDITERKQLERELRYQSARDAVTGLFNRRHFEVELHRTMRLA